MSLTLLDTLLWAAGSLLNAALLCVLLIRGRFRSLPWFTAWIAFGSLFTVVLYAARKVGPHGLYTVLYWSGAFVDMLFQVAVVLEIGRLVLRRRGRWVEGARRKVLFTGAIGTGVAIAIALAVNPMDARGLALWTSRGNIFVAVMVCTLFTGVVAASQQLGLGWRNHAIRVGYGLTVWALTAFAVDSLHGYFGPNHFVKGLDYLQDAVYMGSLVYWILSLWPNEPAPRKITVEEKRRVTALGKELQFGSSDSPRTVDGVLRK